MASEASEKPRTGVGLLVRDGGKGKPPSSGKDMSEEDYKRAKAEGVQVLFEAAGAEDWDTAGEEFAKLVHLCMDYE